MLFFHPFLSGLLAQNINKRSIVPSPWILKRAGADKKEEGKI